MPCRERLWSRSLPYCNGFGASAGAATQPASGNITDALGRPLAQVKVELRDQKGRLIAHAVTDDKGQFNIAPPKPVYIPSSRASRLQAREQSRGLPADAAKAIAMTLDAETALTVPVRAA